jgi:hypothetical protein
MRFAISSVWPQCPSFCSSTSAICTRRRSRRRVSALPSRSTRATTPTTMASSMLLLFAFFLCLLFSSLSFFVTFFVVSCFHACLLACFLHFRDSLFCASLNLRVFLLFVVCSFCYLISVSHMIDLCVNNSWIATTTRPATFIRLRRLWPTPSR